MSQIKRTTALLTVLCLMFLGSPYISSAEDETQENGIVTEEQTEYGDETGSAGNEEDLSDNNEGNTETDEGSQSDEEEPDGNETEPDDTEQPEATGLSPGDSINYTSKRENTGDLEILVFNCTVDGKKYDGTCAQIGTKALSKGTATVTRVSNESRHAKLIYKYAVEKDWWKGPEKDKSAKQELGVSYSTQTTKRKLLEYMNQICIQGSSWKNAAIDGGGMSSSYANTVYTYVNRLDVSDVVVPDGFELYYCDAGPNQNFAVWRFSNGEITSTVVKDGKSGSKNIRAEKSGIIIDTVNYSDLLTSASYALETSVYDKTSGKMLDVSVTTELTPDAPSGSIDIEISLDTSGLKNHTLVVYETLLSEGTEISSHKDPKNKDQTIYVPEIETTATDAETGGHISNAGEGTVIRDVVTYKNLVPGETYEIRGTLMDKDSGKQFTAEGGSTNSSLTFTPDSPDGSVELVFSFGSTGSAGKTAVAFEECIIGGAVIAAHKDINDEEQSIHFPVLSTEAGRHVDGFIIDDVSYKNLTPGMTYTVKGCLIDKKSGKIISGSEGETSFTPETPDGSVNVILDPGDAHGELVAFETLYISAGGSSAHEGEHDIQVAEHKDMECKSQTVFMDGDVPETGDHGVLDAWIAGMVLAGLVLTIMIIRRFRDTV